MKSKLVHDTAVANLYDPPPQIGPSADELLEAAVRLHVAAHRAGHDIDALLETWRKGPEAGHMNPNDVLTVTPRESGVLCRLTYDAPDGRRMSRAVTVTEAIAMLRSTRAEEARRDPQPGDGESGGFPLDDLVQIAHLTLLFGEQQRVTLHADGVMRESDTTHTVMLCLIAARLNPGLDLGELLLMGLVHDLVEAYAGDTSTLRPLTADAAADKATREVLARLRIEKEVPWLGPILERYEVQQHPEARFIRYLDKVMPKLTHLLNGCAAIVGAGMGVDELREKHAEQRAALATSYPEWPGLDVLFAEAAAAAESIHPECQKDPTP